MLWAAWDDHRVVFHRPSGITDFLISAIHYCIAEFPDETRSLGEVTEGILATNAFNYEALGQAAFETVRSLIDTTRSYRLVDSDLGEALATIEGIMQPHEE